MIKSSKGFLKLLSLWQKGKEMLKQLNDTINYIEEHLLDEKVIDEAMKKGRTMF